MDLLTGKIISMTLLGILSLFFGLIPLRIQKKLMKTDEGKPVETQKKQRRRRDLVVSCLLCFGAGVLLATVFLHMLPETRQNIKLIEKKHGNDAQHEHLHDDRGKETHMLGADDHNHDVEWSTDPTAVTSGRVTDSNNNAIHFPPESSALTPAGHEDHSHDGNHVHKRSAEGVGNGGRSDPSPATTGSSRLDADISEHGQLGDHAHGNHDHEHDHAHDHDHEASGTPHSQEPEGHDHKNQAHEPVVGSGNVPEAVTESVAEAQSESAVVPTGTTAADTVDGPLRNDHSGHDHAHAHNEERTDAELNSSTDPDKDRAGVRGMEDHTGHLHDHNLGPNDPTLANRQHDDNLLRTNASTSSHHDHLDHDHLDHDHEPEVLPLHKGEDNSSSASNHDISDHEHDSHGHAHHDEPDAHDHDSPGHADAHGEHDHGHEAAHGYPIAELLICVGFFFVYLVEEIVHKVVFHRHSHSASKRGSKNDGSMVLKNRHSEEDKLPPVTNGTYRSRSVHANVHPYAVENGVAASGDFNARASSGGSLPPKDVWSTSGVDNPSFVNENEVEDPMSRVSVTPHTVGHGHSHMADLSELRSEDWVSNLRSLIIVLALSFHAVFEGLAVGLQQNVQDVWYLFYAIAAHKLVIAFCVGLELISGGTKTFLTVIYMVVFALVTPLGIAIGIIVTEGVSSPHSFGHMWTVTVLQGIAGGTILYVTFCEVLERERSRKSGRFLKFFALVVGFTTMAVIQLVGGHKHTH